MRWVRQARAHVASTMIVALPSRLIIGYVRRRHIARLETILGAPKPLEIARIACPPQLLRTIDRAGGASTVEQRAKEILDVRYELELLAVHVGPQHWSRYVTVNGLEEAIDPGRVPLLITPHVGALHLAALVPSYCGRAGSSITTTSAARLVAFETAVRRSLNPPPCAPYEWIRAEDPKVGIRAMAAVKNGRYLTWAPDAQDVRRGSDLTFFGQSASLPPVVPRIVERFGMQPVLVSSQIEVAPRAHASITFERIDMPPPSDSDAWLQAALDHTQAVIERDVAQWTGWGRFAPSDRAVG